MAKEAGDELKTLYHQTDGTWIARQALFVAEFDSYQYNIASVLVINWKSFKVLEWYFFGTLPYTSSVRKHGSL